MEEQLMGYESRVYIAMHYSNANTLHNVFEVVSVLEVGKTTSIDGFRSLFTHKVNDTDSEYTVDMYGCGCPSSPLWNESEDAYCYVDSYDEPLKFASLDEVIGWCNRKEKEEGELFWRMAALKKSLEMWKEFSDNIVVIHYGH